MLNRRAWWRLGQDRRGVAGIIFGLTIVSLMIFAGMTVDVARLEFVRERLISATDAAALAGGRTLNNSGAGSGYLTDAENFFNANFPSGYMGSTNPSEPTVTLSTDGTLLTVGETVQLPLMFGALLGHPSPMSVTHASTALAGRIEVAMVLDNSGSMAQTVSGDSSSKMTLLQSAATSFISSLTSLQNGNVRIGVVPFTMTVNVGATQGSPPSWIDPSANYIYSKVVNGVTGGSLPTNGLTITSANPSGSAFSDIFTSQTGANDQQNRFTVFSKLGTAWAGCVEMRPNIYAGGQDYSFDTQDTPVSASQPGSYVVPFFAPSEAWTPTTGGADKSGTLTSAGYFQLSVDHYIADYSSDDSKYAWQIQQGDYQKYTTPSNLRSFTTLESSQSNPVLYGGYVFGPNAGCIGFSAANNSVVTVAPLSQITTDTATSTAAIAAMNPMGDTYLPIGLFWGWELISPNSVYSDQQAQYNDPGVTKVVILLTDGCNHDANPASTGTPTATCGAYSSTTTSYDDPDESYYAAVGYAWQNRLGPLSANPNPSGDPTDKDETDRQAIADAETTTICTNLKADGVIIYAIGIDQQGSSNPVLSGCATPGDYYSEPDPGNLTTTFQTIANSLTKVRLLVPAGSEPGV